MNKHLQVVETLLRLKVAYIPFQDTLRFGQFLVNVCGTRDLFYVKDDELVRLAEEFCKNKGIPEDE